MTDSATRPGPGGRLASLDAFRGLAIAGMVLVNNPGSWSYVYAPLRHAAWHGWTPTDLIFPWFLFIVGVAIPIALARRLGEGLPRRRLSVQIARRSLVLVLLGLAMRAVPDFDFGEMRLYGVLQRIGLVYFVVAHLYLWTSARARLGITAGLLLGYWALLSWVAAPGSAAGDLSPDGNLAAYIDRLLMPDRLWAGTWDPEGLLSTFPAIATGLTGVVCGEWMRAARGPTEIVRGLVASGLALGVVGWAWGLVFPINKNLWTSSYVLFTSGTALVTLGATHWAVGFERGRRALAPLAACGRNAILVFVASGMAAKTMGRIRVGGADGTSLYNWIYEHGFRAWAGDYNGSLALALCQVAFWLVVAWMLHRRRIYWKV